MSSIEPDVVDFIFEQGRSATDRQLRDSEALDGKATQLFSAATVVLGLGGISGEAAAALFSAAVIVYMLVSAGAMYALWIVRFRVTDSPAQLLSRYWAEPLGETKYAMAIDMAAGFLENERVLRHKRHGIVVALALTGLETALVAVAVIWNLWA